MNRYAILMIPFVTASLVCLSCATFTPTSPGKEPTPDELNRLCNLKHDLPEFGGEFSSILANLTTHYWDESGDWRGDFQGDATCFAPMLLYALWKDIGVQALLSMADTTVDHEISLVNRFFIWPVPHMDLVIGFPSLAEAYKATGREHYLNLFILGVNAGSMLATYYPDYLIPFMYDRASVYGALSTMSFKAFELTGNDAYKKRGLAIINQADRECWSEGEGLYSFSRYPDWPQATMMMACVAAYRVTGDKAYLNRCRRIVTSMDGSFWDYERGGYFGHPGATSKALSGNNALAWAYLDLYEATGEKVYIEKARSILTWILSQDLYDNETGIIHHHWNRTSGRDKTFCTGCNFHTLCIIYRLNKISRMGI